MTEKIKRPAVLQGLTVEGKCGCGPIYVTLNFFDGKLFEVFVTLGKAGGCGLANKSAIGRLISVGLRSGVSPETIIRTLEGILCYKGTTCISIIAEIIKEHVTKKEG